MTAREEAERILALVGGDGARALEFIERQLNTLHTRAQVLMSLAGVVVTVTGFSGRLIAGTNTAAQMFLVAGLVSVLASAAVVFSRVMAVRWVTSSLDEPDIAGAVEQVLARRNRKTRAYQFGGRILVAGLALYCVAITIMLLNPEPLTVPVR